MPLYVLWYTISDMYLYKRKLLKTKKRTLNLLLFLFCCCMSTDVRGAPLLLLIAKSLDFCFFLRKGILGKKLIFIFLKSLNLLFSVENKFLMNPLRKMYQKCPLAFLRTKKKLKIIITLRVYKIICIEIIILEMKSFIRLSH